MLSVNTGIVGFAISEQLSHFAAVVTVVTVVVVVVDVAGFVAAAVFVVTVAFCSLMVIV